MIFMATFIIQDHKYSQDFERLKLYDVIPENINFSVNGLAWPSQDIYCVHVKSDDVNRTDLHEQCHIVVHHDHDHFCKSNEGDEGNHDKM